MKVKIREEAKEATLNVWLENEVDGVVIKAASTVDGREWYVAKILDTGRLLLFNSINDRTTGLQVDAEGHIQIEKY